MKKLLFVLCLITYSGVWAQNLEQIKSTNENQIMDAKRQMRLNKQFTGSRADALTVDKHYLDPEWKEGFKLDQKMQNEGKTKTFYRYDVLHDRIEKMTFVRPEKGKIYSFAGHFMIYSDYLNADGQKGEGYFDMLNRGNIRLLMRRKMEYKKGTQDMDAYGTAGGSDLKKKYYIKCGDEPAVQIEKDKEVILNTLPDHKEKMADFLKSHFWLGIWTEKQLRKIVNYYNTL